MYVVTISKAELQVLHVKPTTRGVVVDFSIGSDTAIGAGIGIGAGTGAGTGTGSGTGAGIGAHSPAGMDEGR